MKLFALSMLVVAFFSFELYQQKQRITALETALAASTAQNAKLQAQLANAQQAVARTQTTTLNIQPAPTPTPADSSWMFNKRTSLDNPNKHR